MSDTMLSVTSARRLVKFSAKSANEEMQFSVPAEQLCKQTIPLQFFAKPLCFAAKAFFICAMPFAFFAIAFVTPAMIQIRLTMKQINPAIGLNNRAMVFISPVKPSVNSAMAFIGLTTRQILSAMKQSWFCRRARQSCKAEKQDKNETNNFRDLYFVMVGP